MQDFYCWVRSIVSYWYWLLGGFVSFVFTYGKMLIGVHMPNFIPLSVAMGCLLVASFLAWRKEYRGKPRLELHYQSYKAIAFGKQDGVVFYCTAVALRENATVLQGEWYAKIIDETGQEYNGSRYQASIYTIPSGYDGVQSLNFSPQDTLFAKLQDGLQKDSPASGFLPFIFHGMSLEMLERDNARIVIECYDQYRTLTRLAVSIKEMKANDQGFPSPELPRGSYNHA